MSCPWWTCACDLVLWIHTKHKLLDRKDKYKPCVGRDDHVLLHRSFFNSLNFLKDIFILLWKIPRSWPCVPREGLGCLSHEFRAVETGSVCSELSWLLSPLCLLSILFTLSYIQVCCQMLTRSWEPTSLVLTSLLTVWTISFHTPV